MATDYDTPRKTDDDVDSDSLEELKDNWNRHLSFLRKV